MCDLTANGRALSTPPAHAHRRSPSGTLTPRTSQNCSGAAVIDTDQRPCQGHRPAPAKTEAHRLSGSEALTSAPEDTGQHPGTSRSPQWQLVGWDAAL